jgi:galactokinase
MDQFASVMSREGNIILLDCKTLEATYIPINLQPYRILLLNTRVSHALAGSEYNTRRRECEEGVVIIRKNYASVQSLRDVTMEMLQDSRTTMSSKVYNRCRFIIEENNRVLTMAEALQTRDMQRAGALLYEGHTGLSEHYEISCPESDFLVTLSRSIPGVLGARQMGGGFGGCTINLVHREAVDDYINAATKAYSDKFNLQLTSFEGLPREGTSVRHRK